MVVRVIEYKSFACENKKHLQKMVLLPQASLHKGLIVLLEVGNSERETNKNKLQRSKKYL